MLISEDGKRRTLLSPLTSLSLAMKQCEIETVEVETLNSQVYAGGPVERRVEMMNFLRAGIPPSLFLYSSSGHIASLCLVKA